MQLPDFYFQLAPRLRELHFHTYIPKTFCGLNRFLLLPFPLLESFSWTGETTEDWSDWHEGMLSSSKFTLTTPNLRYMHVQQMWMLLPTADTIRLTHLCISSFTFSGSELPTLVNNVLRHCPALTSLVLRKLRTLGRVDSESFAQMQLLPFPHLSRVILADMDFPAIQHFARLFASRPVPCMQIILTDKTDALYANQGELFAALYLRYWSSAPPTDTPRLSVAVHAPEDHPASTGLSVTLTNSTHVLHISLSPTVIEWDLRLPNGRRRRWSEWRLSLLTPLRALPDLREVWLTDMHAIVMSMSADSFPFSTIHGVTGHDLEYGHAQAQAQAAAHRPQVPALETIVVVHNCSARGYRPHNSPSIRPTLVALPKTPYRYRVDLNSQSESSSDNPPMATSPPPLAHLILAVGYDAADAARLRDTWQSALLPGGNGQVEVSATLLRELAMEEYAYVRHAALRVQLMPHLALAPGELARLRECFAAVDVEEIDQIPRVPVPGCVRDEVLAPGGFVPGSVLC